MRITTALSSGTTRGVAAHRVLLVAPSPPPYGGIALQARLLERLLRADDQSVNLFPSNFSLPRWLRFIERIPAVRTAFRSALIWPKLWAQTRSAEVVHVMAASWLYFFLVVCPAVIVGRLLSKRVVINYRGGAAERFFQLYGPIVKPVFKLAHIITAPSLFLAEQIDRAFKLPVHVVPNILDRSAFRFRERSAIAPKFLVTRHLEEIYDVETVLRAFRAIQERYPDASLQIAGTGNQADQLRSLAALWNLRNVRFLGGVPHRELPVIYDQCDILLNASRIDNFPGALLEASAAGLVVVSTDAGGIPFIYRNEKSALLVNIGDWQALAAAAERLLRSPSLGRELAREAHELLRACDWEEVRMRLYSAYGFTAGNRQEQQSSEGATLIKAGGR